MKQILLAVDESDASRRAAEFVDEFFSSNDHSISAVNVSRHPVEWLPETPADGAARWGFPTEAQRREMDGALAERQATGESIASSQAPPGSDIEVRFGETVDAILAAADDIDADLIVVGSNEKGFLERLFSDSVSKEVVRTATRPVLVVS